MLASIAGPDLLIVIAAVVCLFGASQLPKLARSLGSASHEFRRGQLDGTTAEAPGTTAPVDSTRPTLTSAATSATGTVEGTRPG